MIYNDCSAVSNNKIIFSTINIIAGNSKNIDIHLTVMIKEVSNLEYKVTVEG